MIGTISALKNAGNAEATSKPIKVDVVCFTVRCSYITGEVQVSLRCRIKHRVRSDAHPTSSQCHLKKKYTTGFSQRLHSLCVIRAPQKCFPWSERVSKAQKQQITREIMWPFPVRWIVILALNLRNSSDVIQHDRFNVFLSKKKKKTLIVSRWLQLWKYLQSFINNLS